MATKKTSGKNPVARPASKKNIELPLAYALSSERMANALTELLEGAMSVEAVKEAWKALTAHAKLTEKLPQDTMRTLGMWV